MTTVALARGDVDPMFVLSKVVGWLFDPATVLGIAACLSVVAFIIGRRRLARFLAASVSVFIAVLTLTPVGPLSLAMLEHRFPMPALPDRVDGIIVLGGVIDPARSSAADRVILSASSARLRRAAAMAARYPEAMLVYSGGSGSIWNRGPREADAAAPLLRALMGQDRRLLLERDARNTWENTVFSHALAAPSAESTWLLVTSASHMPRAVGCFRTVGWSIVPVPAVAEGPDITAWRPDFLLGINTLRHAVHEAIGLVAYFMLGRTDALFPGPWDRRA